MSEVNQKNQIFIWKFPKIWLTIVNEIKQEGTYEINDSDNHADVLLLLPLAALFWHKDIGKEIVTNSHGFMKYTIVLQAGSECQSRLFSFSFEHQQPITIKEHHIMSTSSSSHAYPGIPLPIVTLNRVVLLTGITAAIVFQQPLVTTALFFIILSAVVFGPKGSLIFFTGSRLFAKQNLNAKTEDPKLMRFNNSIAAILLGGAQIAFLLGAPLAGWILSGFVAVAAAIALAGFCFGCFLFYQFNLQRFKLFGSQQN